MSAKVNFKRAVTKTEYLPSMVTVIALNAIRGKFGSEISKFFNGRYFHFNANIWMLFPNVPNDTVDGWSSKS